jgi:hypothetical protein
MDIRVGRQQLTSGIPITLHLFFEKRIQCLRRFEEKVQLEGVGFVL